MKILRSSKVFLLGVGLVAGVITVSFSSQTRADDAKKAPAVDVNAAAESLAAYMRIDTVTPPVPPTDTTHPYIPFLIENYAKPLGLEYEVFLNRTLLLKWRSGNQAEKPLLLPSHSDVVPVAKNELDRWTHAPFEGVVKDGYVWGRGAIDMKGVTVAQLEAVRAMQEAGIKPSRDVIFLINPDEEIGGSKGAGWFVAEHKDKLEDPLLTIDEGSFVVPDVIPGKNLVAVAVGEKRYLTVKLTVETKSGHSSMPGDADAPDILVKALSRAVDLEYPAKLLPPMQQFLGKMAEYMAFPESVILRNEWLFGGLILGNFEKKPATNAVIRTTHALTIVDAGVKDNVIPRKAEAFVNFRILPGDDRDEVLRMFAEALDDERVEITPLEDWGESPLAPYEGPLWQKLNSIFASEVPNSVVAPSISPATADARYFAQAGIPTYRIAPFTLDAAERKSVHGVDERLSLKNLEQAIKVYAALMERL